MKTYTNTEIQTNINDLADKIYRLETDSKGNRKEINFLKNQIAYWEGLDRNQYRMFF